MSTQKAEKQQQEERPSAPRLKPILGAEKRGLERTDIRLQDGVRAEFLTSVGTRVPVRVFDLSSTGINILVDGDVMRAIQESTSSVDLRVLVREAKAFEASYKVRWINESQGGYRIGLELRESDATPQENAPFLRLTSDFPLIGYLFCDFHYQEKTVANVIRIGRDTIEVTIDEGPFLYPGLELTLHFSPILEQRTALRTEVISIRRERPDDKSSSRVRVRLKIGDLKPLLKKLFTEHLVANPENTIAQIRQIGFEVRKIAHNFRFRYVKTQEEYEQVLALRLKAYHLAGKVTDGSSLEKMVAPLDSISRILIVLHGDRIVGSVSLSFPDSNDLVLDTERALEGGYPATIPPKTSMIEVARLVTDPDYRKTDLLLRIFEHVYRIFALSGRQYLITSCDDNLWRLYKKLGFSRTGLSYPHPHLKGINHHLITIHIKVPTAGATIGPLRWSILYANMTSHLEQTVRFERTVRERIRIKAFKLISSVLGRRY